MTTRPRSRTAAAVAACLALLCLAIAAPAAWTESTQGDQVRVIFQGKLTPRSLPREGLAPVRVAVGATIEPTAGANPPPLRQITIEINRHGRFAPEGLPVCQFHDVQPSTTANALRACRSSLVGRGKLTSNVVQATEAPFPSEGELYAFNGTYRGKPAILAHIYGSTPIPTSYTIPFTISKGEGAYGTRLSAPMPKLSSEWGYITGLSLNLGRVFKARGKRLSYLSAGCPAPKGVGLAPFKFARASFYFGADVLSSTLTRTCRAQG